MTQTTKPAAKAAAKPAAAKPAADKPADTPGPLASSSATDEGGVRILNAPVSSARVPSRRGDVSDDLERASSSGYYLDADGRQRVLGAGLVVPEGWTRVGDRDLAERAANTPTLYDHFPGRTEPRA